MKKHELYQALYELLKIRISEWNENAYDLFNLVNLAGETGISATQLARKTGNTPQETARYLRIWEDSGMVKRVGSGTEKRYCFDGENIEAFLRAISAQFFDQKTLYSQVKCLRHEWLCKILESVQDCGGQSRAQLQKICPEKSSAAFNDGIRRLIESGLICYDRKGYYLDQGAASMLECLNILSAFRNKYQTQAIQMLEIVNAR